ncbi:rRNA N6-adenosine-methyltransferase Mettl5 isoform X2 [Condylostylus longicornis]|uniref:rRNA N6-adenosine-methyltransferase Mettl5 isoform X2 n=1 Tax=Condylostylus longicornis TaxID=2530218 RepID=UPI00244DE651|nr:rRNA N6-adenosine-methyltransferase Mettl5 isoform X2 [Condylostylus longicornis]
MAKLKLKKLEEYLQDTDSFENPKVSLEQYPTPSHIASYMLYNMQFMYGDIENKIIGDLGSGCGVLSIGASLLGASQTIGFEIDREAIEIFRNNVVDMEIPSIDIVQINVLNGLKDSRWTNIFDTIVMNPPFGTKNNAGMDIKFLETAINLSNNAVYSLHKTSTRFEKWIMIQLNHFHEIITLNPFKNSKFIFLGVN